MKLDKLKKNKMLILILTIVATFGLLALVGVFSFWIFVAITVGVILKVVLINHFILRKRN